MRTSIITGIVALTSSLVSAQYNVTSKPFHLVINSKNKTLDGVALASCHEGAAIEGLCLGGKLSSNSDVYNFNTSYQNSPSQPPTGYLAWLLKGANFQLSEPLTITSSLTSNVAIPLFTPEEYGSLVGFDKKNKLYVPGYIDDTTSPIKTSAAKNYYRWYICNTYYGYSYTTLAWGLGIAKPQNPSCQRVDVVRVFVKPGY